MDILVTKTGGRVKYTTKGSTKLFLMRDIAVIEYSNGHTEIVNGLNESTAEIYYNVDLPENFVGDKFDYIGGTFVPVPEPEVQV